MRKIVCVGAALAVVLAAVPLVSVARAEAQKGKLAVSAENWSAYLYPTPRAKMIRLKGGTDPVEVPAGTYRVKYTISASPGKGRQPARISGTVNKVVVEAGKTTELKIEPLEAQVLASLRGGKMKISVAFKDAGGSKAMLYSSPPAKAKRADPPKVDVVDTGGKTIYTATMKFG
jgi:hypothetical protein